MKLLRIIKEEIVPFSSRQNLVLLLIISCIFQFGLFYTPALAEDAVKQAKAQTVDKDQLVTTAPIIKKTTMDRAAAELSPERSVAAIPSPVAPAPAPEVIASESPLATTTSASSTPAAKVIRTSIHVMTAYNSEAAQTDDSPCITANGFNVCEHGVEDTIAANFLKFGTKVKIPELFGDRVFVVRDRMNKRHGQRVDIWMKDRKAALKFGIKTAKIQVIE